MNQPVQFTEYGMKIIGLLAVGLNKVEIAYQLQIKMDELLRHLDHIIEIAGAAQTPPVPPNEVN